jgi:hypothetical protein
MIRMKLPWRATHVATDRANRAPAALVPANRITPRDV